MIINFIIKNNLKLKIIKNSLLPHIEKYGTRIKSNKKKQQVDRRRLAVPNCTNACRINDGYRYYFANLEKDNNCYC